MNDYEREFERLVHEYNRWFYSPVRQAIERPVATFFNGKTYADDLPSHDLHLVFAEYPCFYERDDLNAIQKAALAVGSDLKRLEDRSKRGLVECDELVTQALTLFVQVFYREMKEKYVGEAVFNEALQKKDAKVVQYPLTGDLMDSQPPGAMVKPSYAAMVCTPVTR